MYVLVTYKNEEDQIKMNELEWSNITELYLDTQGQLTIVAGQNWPKIKPIKDFIVVLDTCKNGEDPSRNRSIRVFATLISLKVFVDCFRHSRTANFNDPCSILLNFKPIQAFVAVTCKNE